MSNFDKPYKSIKELCNILKKRNLDLGNEQVATNLLQLYGYYPLINGYKNPFLDTTNPKHEIYKKDSTLKDIYSLYLIDSEFQELFLTSVLKIEKHLANTLGNEVAYNFGVQNNNSYLTYISKRKGKDDGYVYKESSDSYLDLNNYVGKFKKKCLKKINKNIYYCKDNPTLYYKNHHNHIPPWILVQNLTFGVIINYYQIQLTEIKDKIVNEMITSIKNEDREKKKVLFYTEIQLLSFFRNEAAHSSPIYLFRISEAQHPTFYFAEKKALKLYLGIEIFEKGDSPSLGTNDLYAAFLALLLLNRDDTQRAYFIDRLCSIENKYKNNSNFTQYYKKYVHEAGLPDNYINRLKSASDNLMKNELKVQDFEREDSNGIIHKKTIFSLQHIPTSVSMMKYVYFSKNGNKYHLYKDCSYIKNTSTEKILMMEAMDNGLIECKRCENKYKSELIL